MEACLLQRPIFGGNDIFDEFLAHEKGQIDLALMICRSSSSLSLGPNTVETVIHFPPRRTHPLRLDCTVFLSDGLRLVQTVWKVRLQRRQSVRFAKFSSCIARGYTPRSRF